MLNHDEAQELHECIGQAINRDGDWLVALERAQELAAILVSDTDPANAPPVTPASTAATARSTQAVSPDKHGDDTHPTFAVAGAVRREGTPRTLFQSDLKHSSTIVVSVHTATRKRDLNRDWIHPRHELIEFEMSEVQWGAFVSSMGKGSGVPVTLRRTESQSYIPQLPYEPRMSKNRQEVDDVVGKLFANVKAALDELEELENNKGGVKARREARKKLQGAFMNAGPNARFAVDSLTEAAESVVDQAKADIETHALQAAQRMGIELPVTFSMPEITAKHNPLPMLDEPAAEDQD